MGEPTFLRTADPDLRVSSDASCSRFPIVLPKVHIQNRLVPEDYMMKRCPKDFFTRSIIQIIRSQFSTHI